MKLRSPLPLIVSLVVTALLATLLVSAPGTARAAEPDSSGAAVAAKARKPSDDFPRMPRECATPKEKIPPEPIICGLNKYDRTRPSVVLWGDSHSWMFIPAIKAAAKGHDVNLVAVMMGSCPPMDNQVKYNDKVPACFRSNALGIRVARKLEANGRPYRIILAGSWQRYVHALKVKDRESYVGQMALAMRKGTPRLARTLRSIGSRVEVIGQVATVPEQHKRCAQGNEPYACSLPRKKSLPEASATRNYVAKALKPVLGSRKAIDVNAEMCTKSVCKGKIGSVRTWFDDLHLSATKSATMAPYFAAIFDAVDPAPVPGPTTPVPSCPIPLLC